MSEHDPETVRRGRENIARIRAQLGAPAKSATADRPDPPTLEPDHPVDELTADRIKVEMATAEERDQMRQTVARLEARVAQLEATLAAVVRTAANGIESTAADQAAR